MRKALRRQLEDHRVHAIGLQESRPRKAGIEREGNYLVASVQGDNSSGFGCELFVATHLAFGTFRKKP
eukprot:4023048-Karenia_brevis.AAC.1